MKYKKYISIIFGTDYTLTQKFIPFMGWLACLGVIIFHFLEKSYGYWDSFWFRITLSVICLPVLFISRSKPLNLWRIASWEFALFSVLPVMNTYYFLMNNQNKYWFSSWMLAALTLGLCTKFYLLPIHIFFGIGGTTLVYAILHHPTHEYLAESLQAQILASLSIVTGAIIKTALEYSHVLATEAKVAEAKARDLKVANEELKKREDLIRLYVRPSLVEEIRAGKDPSKSAPVIRNLSIMFCDIREFTKLTEELTPYERQMFLNQYFSMMTRPIVENGGEVDKIMGDCVMSIFPDGHTAVNAAIAMRLELQKFNETMFSAQSPMIRNGIGIAKGDVMQGNFGSFEKLDRTVIGEAVNIASRLESKTKMYNLEVVVTEDVIKDLPDGFSHYRWIDNVQVKGSTRHIKLFEIYGHQPPEVRKYKDETRDLMEKALTIYFQKGFKDASRLFRAMLEKVPPHRLKVDDLMDNIINYYIAHCDAWINNPNGTWDEIQRWDGVHVFTEK